MNNDIIYTIYKTTNLVNGKIYIGQHQTTDLNDGYLGSGIHLLRAIKKHGKHKFIKEVLFAYDNFEEMNNKEIELLSSEFILQESNYNLNLGGSNFALKSQHIYDKISKSNSNRVTCKNKNDPTGVCFNVTKEEFDSNDELVGVSYGTKNPYTPTDEHKKINSEYMKNRIVSVDTRNKMSSKKKGLVSCKNKHDPDGKIFKVPHEEFKSNPDLVGINYGRKICDAEKENLRKRKSGMVQCKNKITGLILQVTIKEFKSNSELVRL